MFPSESLAARTRESLQTIQDFLGILVARYRRDEVLTAVRQFPAREAKFRPMPASVTSALAEAYRTKGIEQLYSHQASTAELVRDGKNVVVVTPTASGKTLCYNLPVLNAVLENPDTRALYLFPNKALAQDQLAELQDLAKRLDDSFGVFTYDGDTPSDARKAIRERGHIVLTNPDMLHTGILPHHTKWMRLFENLRYIVLDELHSYRGVFGSHLANVLRRLKRVAKFYGSDPQFICCSATIANPGELASQLIEKQTEVVEENGAPAGEKLFVFYNPPMINRNLGIRRSYINEATRVAKEILTRKLQTIVFANSRLHTEVILTYLQQANPAKAGKPEPIRGYRGGYLPGERREIERGLRDGGILGVVATNALELGIDVGSLDACVMAGYPGTIASTWQRAGRAGRRSGSSCAVFVASSAPLDQFIVQHPDYFFGNSPEHAHVQPDNLEILVNHLKCAAFELPISPDERFGNVDLPELCQQLGEAGFLHQSGGDWHWIDEAYPADTISLRSVTSDNFVIIDTTGEDRGKPEVIGEVDFSSALTTVHPKAIYIHQGQQYHVEHLDFDKRKAYGLTLHPEKTRLLEFGRYAEERAKKQGKKKPGTFDFLGLTHICARSRRGKFTVHVRTMRKRLRRSLTAVAAWCQEHRHAPVDEQQKTLNAKLRGHYQYYGRPTNSQSLLKFYRGVVRIWRKWLNRRTRGNRMTWERYKQLLRRHPLLPPRICHVWM